MPRRPAAEEHTNTSVQNRRKATQLERLVAATITTANRDGYAGSTVAAVIEEAGVSRPTFYDYFEDRDDGFVATVLDVRGRLLADVRRALEEEEPQDALAGALRANVEFASSNPAAARFLMKESLAGGPGALDARDAGIGEIAKAVEKALKSLPGDQRAPDLPAAAVIGAVQRLLASRLRR